MLYRSRESATAWMEWRWPGNGVQVRHDLYRGRALPGDRGWQRPAIVPARAPSLADNRTRTLGAYIPGRLPSRKEQRDRLSRNSNYK